LFEPRRVASALATEAVPRRRGGGRGGHRSAGRLRQRATSTVVGLLIYGGTTDDLGADESISRWR
jgi:hypothetical protein